MTPAASRAVISRVWQRASVLAWTSTALSVSSSVALCDDDSNMVDKVLKAVGLPDLDSAATQVGHKIGEVVETGVPTQLSYGFVSGYCSGFALKKAGKVAAVILGISFMGLQSLSYSGYIDVNHDKLKQDVEDLIDLNDDGKIDQKDGKLAWGKLQEVLEYNMPAGSGFGVGLIAGLRG
mmetsp:Transcript_35769/g.55028  ORF Transcript_35769/g.55028 Transcript_35769/m.55028 type:complete len:179 (+) Transcript_35769:73-609(+)|eukprot:CAMPEP_0118700314 /NCGR_PEP_ID=MMETSP0800-20121206/16496_1 /TAXON_ID=210618 ORGANISM="Striatella unipunctata, Strain CCMP2910" /NCGR_SAMPLE_ID=MMETSP0800 /ASSEMBLY_ACC=CAM_ASM_000638 /LENGTH=178 /DNA_ID=CAMNT_0006600849 /DNA_START=62 /DNA_END=598 /DNA_ORIENTATION=+